MSNTEGTEMDEATRRFVEKVGGLHDAIARDVPELNHVYCTVCGHEMDVEGGDCLRHGWPKCCGKTMHCGRPQ